VITVFDWLQVCPSDDSHYSKQFIYECLPLLFNILRYSKVPLSVIYVCFLGPIHHQQWHNANESSGFLNGTRVRFDRVEEVEKIMIVFERMVKIEASLYEESKINVELLHVSKGKGKVKPLVSAAFAVVSTNPHWVRMVGYSPISLWITPVTLEYFS
jgi:hypothetical protein